MYRRNRVLYVPYCILLFIVSPSSSREDSKSDNEQSGNLIMHHDLHTNFEKDQIDKDELMQYNSRENSAKSYDKMRRESLVNFTENDRTDDDSMIYDVHTYDLTNDEENDHTKSTEYIKTGSTKVNNENNSTSQWIYGNLAEIEDKDNYTVGDDNTLRNDTCKGNKCIRLCCPYNNILIRGKCTPRTGDFHTPTFPKVYGLNDSSRGTYLDEIIQLIVRHPCPNAIRMITLDPNEYVIHANGTVHLLPYKRYYTPARYCLAVVNRDAYDVNICKARFPIFLTVGVLVSMPFLMATFVVYTIIPELQNMHSYMLRGHVISLFFTYMILPAFHQFAAIELGRTFCTCLAYLLNFTFGASFLWLNVICFDIWLAFKDLRPVQKINMKQQEREKFIWYALYAWGVPLFLNIICVIMEYIPNLPNYVIRPSFCTGRIWFGNTKAMGAYFYFPVGVTIICNIFLFSMTAFKITRQKKKADDDLSNFAESKRHNENKQRFVMYLKLFIIMGILWIMEIASFVVNRGSSSVNWYVTDMINTLQGVIIFIIFVCKKKIKLLLYKKLQWESFGRRKSPVSSRVNIAAAKTSRMVEMRDISPRIKTQ